MVKSVFTASNFEKGFFSFISICEKTYIMVIHFTHSLLASSENQRKIKKLFKYSTEKQKQKQNSGNNDDNSGENRYLIKLLVDTHY